MSWTEERLLGPTADFTGVKSKFQLCFTTEMWGLCHRSTTWPGLPDVPPVAGNILTWLKTAGLNLTAVCGTERTRERSGSQQALGLWVTALSKGFCHRQFLPSPQHVNLFHLLNGKVNAVTFKKKKVYSILLSNYLQFRGNEVFFGFYVYDHETYNHMFLFFFFT